MLDAQRRFYAEEIRAVAGIVSDALVEAFARVPREHFLGPGPWQIARMVEGVPGVSPYKTTPDADPARIHHNVVVAIDPARALNNGQPTALATWIDALGLRGGEHVVHIGAGVGYYSAILGEVVGRSGRVRAIEIDLGLAARARDLLAAWPQVSVECSDAAAPGPADAILVNAGCTRPRATWLAALSPGGRLVLPLTATVPGLTHGAGAVVRVTAREGGVWAAAVVSKVAIYDCAGARDPADQPALLGLLRATAPIRSLILSAHEPSPTCVAHTATYCLSSAPP